MHLRKISVTQSLKTITGFCLWNDDGSAKISANVFVVFGGTKEEGLRNDHGSFKIWPSFFGFPWELVGGI